MNMVCPRCGENFEQRLVCPKCKVRLALQSVQRDMTLPLARLTDLSNATPWSRILVALLLSLGIFFGLKQLCMAGLLAAGDELHAEIWTTRGGPALVLALQSVGLLLGGILVGAGQRRGPSNGFIVGTCSGLVFAAAFPSEVPSIGRYSLVVDLVYLSFVGVVSGWFGKRIWSPASGPRRSICRRVRSVGSLQGS
jgi:hypothetical protein